MNKDSTHFCTLVGCTVAVEGTDINLQILEDEIDHVEEEIYSFARLLRLVV